MPAKDHQMSPNAKRQAELLPAAAADAVRGPGRRGLKGAAMSATTLPAGAAAPRRAAERTRPGACPAPDARHPAQRDGPEWITLAATPFLLGAFFQGATGMVTDLAAFGLVASGMVLTREGLVAQATYAARRVAKRPAIPHRAVRRRPGGAVDRPPGAESRSEELADAGLIGTSLALHQLSFGLDPWRDKGRDGGRRLPAGSRSG